MPPVPSGTGAPGPCTAVCPSGPSMGACDPTKNPVTCQTIVVIFTHKKYFYSFCSFLMKYVLILNYINVVNLLGKCFTSYVLMVDKVFNSCIVPAAQD